MGGQFETYGPYPMSSEISALDEQQITQWFLKEVDTKQPGLSGAVGLYIICAASSEEKLLPWYVGKTTKGFLKRFRQHSRMKKGFGGGRKEWAGKEAFVFFIALSSGRREFRKPIAGKGKILAVNAIEEMLIQDCLKLNGNLLNVSNKTLYRDLSVPGYVGRRKSSTNSAATELAKLFASA